ncbi:hypothetical protein GA0061096_1354 [Fictibacillus enclensis]|nr:hypothetical protein GA0061096_1354 [Fictibacillus enclensis]
MMGLITDMMLMDVMDKSAKRQAEKRKLKPKKRSWLKTILGFYVLYHVIVYLIQTTLQ